MESFKFRIHYGTQRATLLRALTNLIPKCSKMIVYDHENDNAERPHFHGLVENATVGLKRFKELIVEQGCKFKGQKEWSFSTTYDDASENPIPVDKNFIKYMSKGKYSPVLTLGYTFEEIEEQRLKWIPDTEWNVSRGFLEISGAKIPAKKLSKREVVEEVELYLLRNNSLRTDTNIRDAIVHVLKKDNQLLGLYKVMDLYDGYNMYYNKTRFDDHFDAVLTRRALR